MLYILLSFNPHPRSTAGVTSVCILYYLPKQVSILTRDQLRASLDANEDESPEDLFQSSPAINCGRHQP